MAPRAAGSQFLATFILYLFAIACTAPTADAASYSPGYGGHGYGVYGGSYGYPVSTNPQSTPTPQPLNPPKPPVVVYMKLWVQINSINSFDEQTAIDTLVQVMETAAGSANVNVTAEEVGYIVSLDLVLPDASNKGLEAAALQQALLCAVAEANSLPCSNVTAAATARRRLQRRLQDDAWRKVSVSVELSRWHRLLQQSGTTYNLRARGESLNAMGVMTTTAGTAAGLNQIGQRLESSTGVSGIANGIGVQSDPSLAMEVRLSISVEAGTAPASVLASLQQAVTSGAVTQALKNAGLNVTSVLQDPSIVTPTQPPTAATPTPTAATPAPTAEEDDDDGAPLGVIIGATVGGVVALALVAVGVVLLIKRRKAAKVGQGGETGETPAS